MKKLRILFYLNILRDGAGMINREAGFAEELAARGHEVTILSHFRATKSVAKPVRVETVFKTPYTNWLYDRPFGFPKTIHTFQRVVRRLRPHVVMVDLPQEAKWAIRYRRKYGYRVLFTYHGVANGKYYSGQEAETLDRLRNFGHEMLRQSDSIVVVSDFLKDEIDSLGRSAHRLHNGVDRKLFSSSRSFKNLGARGPIVLFIGRYTPYKGAINVVRAFARIASEVPDAELVMRGFFEDGSYLSQMQAIVDEHGINSRVHFLGPLDGSEMPYWMNLSTIFANGSDDETFCMPLLEAESCGVACLGFKAGGVPEVVKHGETGFLAEPEDIEGYALNMKRLLCENDLRAEFQAAASEHAEKFTYANLTNQLEPILLDLVSRKRGSGSS